MPAATREEGLSRIEALIQRFAANEAHYLTAAFDETSTREQFVNGLFDALGWDVLDTEGHGANREVIFHPRLRDEPSVAGAEEWDEDLTEDELAAREPIAQIPDYAFRYDGSTRFFVEAKRSGLSLEARAPAFQVKSYAWSHRVRVAVVSNFRQLRVFETLTRPEYENPTGGLIDSLALDFRQYTERWDQLWDMLSREAVAAGSIERTTRYRRGAVRVDEAFLDELTEWRERLARDLVDRNADLDRWELAEATQRILDRLIFLRVCEDRTLEQDVVLRRYARRTDAFHQLRAEMRRLDGVYNGVLFAPHFSERLELSDDVLQRFIEKLYFPYSPYRFDVIDVDLLGAVYERFLGTEITLDARRHVQVEEKPEVRHAGGVYYTPPWVVREVVRGCIEPLLDGRTPRTAEGLRIVDPACGSGSFLLGALDFLTGWHERYYTEHPDVDRDRHYRAADGGHRLTSDAKAAIVRRNLFGVDIDPQAVEVAQMSLYLKILEAETGASLHERPRLFPGPFLPSLSENIRSGNSLLAPDDVPAQLMLDDELRHRINPFDWHDEQRGFGQIFVDRGGFDAVIGNPPYTRVQVLNRYRSEEAQLYLRSFETAEAGYDIATLFVEKGLSLLRGPRGGDRGGRLGYIITRTFCETDAAMPLRRLLSLRNHVAEIVDFGSGTVGATGFERAFPRAAEWLKANEEHLRSRAGTWNDENWILFSRRQNLERFPEPKVLVPYMTKGLELTAAADDTGAFFVNVTSGGYGVGLDPEFAVTREYLAALLNSELLSWILKRYSRAWRGDYVGARKGNLARLPIVIADDETQTAVIDAFGNCVAAATAVDAARSDHDRESLGRIYDSAVGAFDRLVFDLYEITPDELRVIRSM